MLRGTRWAAGMRFAGLLLSGEPPNDGGGLQRGMGQKGTPLPPTLSLGKETLLEVNLSLTLGPAFLLLKIHCKQRMNHGNLQKKERRDTRYLSRHHSHQRNILNNSSVQVWGPEPMSDAPTPVAGCGREHHPPWKEALTGSRGDSVRQPCTCPSPPGV